jgi:hypothetical protein
LSLFKWTACSKSAVTKIVDVSPDGGDATATPAAVPTSRTPIVAASHLLVLVGSTRNALSSPSIARDRKGRSIMAMALSS